MTREEFIIHVVMQFLLSRGIDTITHAEGMTSSIARSAGELYDTCISKDSHFSPPAAKGNSHLPPKAYSITSTDDRICRIDGPGLPYPHVVDGYTMAEEECAMMNYAYAAGLAKGRGCEPSSTITRLIGALALMVECYEKHDEWCGNKEDAPGNNIHNVAIRTARAALSSTRETDPAPQAAVREAAAPSNPAPLYAHTCGMADANGDPIQCEACDHDSRITAAPSTRRTPEEIGKAVAGEWYSSNSNIHDLGRNIAAAICRDRATRPGIAEIEVDVAELLLDALDMLDTKSIVPMARDRLRKAIAAAKAGGA